MTPEGRQSCRSGVFINLEHISHLVLVFLLLTLNMQLPTGNAIFRGALKTLSNVFDRDCEKGYIR